MPYIGYSTVIGFDLSLYSSYTSISGIQYKPITSIFTNPNILGFLSLVGTVCAAIEYRLYQTRLAVGLFGISFIGLVLTNYQAGWLAFAGFVLLLLSYYSWGRNGVLITTFVGAVCSAGTLAIIFSLIPGPDIIQSQDLTHRKSLWLAGATAITKNPVMGTGFGTASLAMEPFLERLAGYTPHNSFLRLFIETGIVGGIAYFAVHTFATIQTGRKITDERSFFLFGLVVIVVITQMFEAFSLFGLSMRSIISSVGIGYALNNLSIRTSDSTMNT
ncbi:O-antigen ligase family protein [Haloarcula marismortui]|uniref:O-antigen ligase family protein n=1 Tax=Haloarcula marismortui TaxID=2238 RepID=UPI001378CCFA|nr:O-antigen ligase family protein [Haloarcula californiae]